MSSKLPGLPAEVDVLLFKTRARSLAGKQYGRLTRRDIEQLFWACAPALVEELRAKGTYDAACEKLRGFYFPALLAIVNEDILGKPVVEGAVLRTVDDPGKRT